LNTGTSSSAVSFAGSLVVSSEAAIDEDDDFGLGFLGAVLLIGTLGLEAVIGLPRAPVLVAGGCCQSKIEKDV